MDENRFWLLASKKIAGELSADETTELELLFIHNPDYRSIIGNLLRINTNRPPLSSESEEKILKNLRSKLSSKAPVHEMPEDIAPQAEEEEEADEQSSESFWVSYKKKIVLSSFFGLLLVAVILLAFHRDPGHADTAIHFSENNIATKPGSRSQVKLPDGTLVMLNGDSKLSYPDNFLGDTRDVTLEGEAYFEVTENKAKPFIIHLKAMDIKVLGTVFNVRAYPGELSSEAALIKGSIEVTLKNRRNEKIMLKPNEKISVTTTAEADENKTIAAAKNNIAKQHYTDVAPLISVDHLNMDEREHIIKEIGWTQNKLMFKNENLESIAVTLQRWYGRNIEIRSDKLKEQKFTGNFNNESLMQVIQALQVSYNFNFKRENNLITIY